MFCAGVYSYRLRVLAGKLAYVAIFDIEGNASNSPVSGGRRIYYGSGKLRGFKSPLTSLTQDYSRAP